MTQSEIGTSRGGRPITLITLASETETRAPETRPGILIVAGADGMRPIDSALAIDQCARLLDGAADSAEAKLLSECVIYVVPTLNPDGMALGRHGNATTLDLDRDGTIDEDGTNDLDGNGVITSMRWAAPDGMWIPDPDEPRLMRKAKTEDGERGTHHVELEAKDDDGDEERAEDPGHGIWIDRTFSHRFDEFDRSTGRFAMQEPETRALADFVYAHRNIMFAFVWGRDDNLLETPKVAKPKSRVQNDGILDGDKSLFEKVGKLYRETTDRSGKNAARMDGSPWSWLYLQVGVPTFASDVWRPTKLEDEKKKDELKLAKRRLAAANSSAGSDFVDWKPFEHPELGAVEIGGFVQRDISSLMPDSERDTLFAAHHAFFVEACAMRPHVHVESFTAEPLDGGAFRIEAHIVNDGQLPALTATGTRTRRFSVPRLTLMLDGQTMLAGRDRPRVRNLDPHGGREEFSWVIAGKKGSKVQLDLRVDPVGSTKAEVTL